MHSFVEFHKRWLEEFESISATGFDAVAPTDRFDYLLPRFCEKYYSEERARSLIVGINPGRKGSGLTGVPFTDGMVLANAGIDSEHRDSKEQTSQFMMEVRSYFGGDEKFYRHFMLGAAVPICITNNGKNVNYYDSGIYGLYNWGDAVRRSLIDQKEISKSANNLIVVGSGQNFKFLKYICEEYCLFDDVVSIEHPRYVMQYKYKYKIDYVRKYVELLKYTSAVE